MCCIDSKRDYGVSAQNDSQCSLKASRGLSSLLIPSPLKPKGRSKMKNLAGHRVRSSARFGLIALVGLTLARGAAVRGQSALDSFDTNANGNVRVVVVQPDGKILIGGDFTTVAPNGGVPVTRNHIARLNSDGTLDTAFNPDANDIVF